MKLNLEERLAGSESRIWHRGARFSAKILVFPGRLCRIWCGSLGCPCWCVKDMGMDTMIHATAVL